MQLAKTNILRGELTVAHLEQKLARQLQKMRSTMLALETPQNQSYLSFQLLYRKTNGIFKEHF